MKIYADHAFKPAIGAQLGNTAICIETNGAKPKLVIDMLNKQRADYIKSRGWDYNPSRDDYKRVSKAVATQIKYDSPRNAYFNRDTGYVMLYTGKAIC